MLYEVITLAPPGGPSYEPWMASSRPEVLAAFDKNTVAARSAISAADEGRWTNPWSLLMGGKEILTMPRIAILRNFVLRITSYNVCYTKLLRLLRQWGMPGPATTARFETHREGNELWLISIAPESEPPR